MLMNIVDILITVFGIPAVLFLWYIGIKNIMMLIDWCECKIRGLV